MLACAPLQRCSIIAELSPLQTVVLFVESLLRVECGISSTSGVTGFFKWLQVALKFEHRSSKGCNYGPPYEWSVYKYAFYDLHSMHTASRLLLSIHLKEESATNFCIGRLVQEGIVYASVSLVFWGFIHPGQQSYEVLSEAQIPVLYSTNKAPFMHAAEDFSLWVRILAWLNLNTFGYSIHIAALWEAFSASQKSTTRAGKGTTMSW